ncbi:hypothetical protein BD779DRAFT_1481266 [Infundibulicybe gibba]|nr:hypothetical protein BD779DRAFT_1481266 [Infundibulicybe gibba]
MSGRDGYAARAAIFTRRLRSPAMRFLKVLGCAIPNTQAYPTLGESSPPRASRLTKAASNYNPMLIKPPAPYSKKPMAENADPGGRFTAVLPKAVTAGLPMSSVINEGSVVGLLGSGYLADQLLDNESEDTTVGYVTFTPACTPKETA